MAFLKRAFKIGRKVIASPLLSRGISGARAVADTLGLIGVPGASALGKGLSYAEKGIDVLQRAKMKASMPNPM